MGQPKLRLRRPAGQHQRRPNLIGGELIGHRHPRQLLIDRHQATHPDIHHRGHHPGPLVIRLSTLRLEDLHTIETRQPRQLKTSQDARQLRPRRNTRQVLGNQLPNTHEHDATTRHRQKRGPRAATKPEPWAPHAPNPAARTRPSRGVHDLGRQLLLTDLVTADRQILR